MNSRKMWAPKGWEKDMGFRVFESAPSGPDDLAPIRVLVQEIPEGMPDFRPGDRVWSAGEVVEIVGWPQRARGDGDWIVPISRQFHFACVVANSLTKIPPTVTRLIRVTGPKDGVEIATNNLLGKTLGFHPIYPEGVRVEVVDERAGCDR